ncbi:uncharacterized protein NPIL_327741 [Nephila pilipes]|uniref:Thyroglobulin type-1 domain-containing protein n=1 Tax=Nephila pilipes TaxID=299642 RepID=A0A8X6QQ90_NEPPI|nr:uncharacterized protein NPIL_327741 [Nephila pilipes]
MLLSFVIVLSNLCIIFCAEFSSISRLERFKCHKGFCKTITCETITHCPGGYIAPSSTYCGCCDSCIQILEENEECEEPLKGSLKDIKASQCEIGLKCIRGRCSLDDPLLRCIQHRERRRKKRNQEFYSEDLWIPECDENGNFRATQHKKRKSICFDTHGNKLFGQMDPEFSENMTCGCSRHMDYLQKANPSTFNIHPQEHCSIYGDFESLQCIRDLCYCSDPVTGQVQGRIVKMAYINKLPCYDREIHDNGILKECEKELHRTRFLHFHFRLKGLEVFGMERFQCDLDGTFSPRQCDLDNCVCTDKNGIGIKSYFIGIEDFEKLKTEMTCGCARDVGGDSYISQSPILKCKGYGNYFPFQCFLKDQCFCVDADGDVISKMMNQTDELEMFCDNNLKNLDEQSEITSPPDDEAEYYS